MPAQTLKDLVARRQTCPPYQVLLHNDDCNTMDHVVRSITRSVPQVPVREAMRIMLAAHRTGVACVITCPLEHAELYRDNLQSCGLTATIEAE